MRASASRIMGDYATGLCTISRVFLDSPALDAGLRKGDVLTRVEDIDVVTTTLQDAVNIMRGEPGTPSTCRCSAATSCWTSW